MYIVQILFAYSLELYGGNCVSEFFLGLSFYLMPKMSTPK